MGVPAAAVCPGSGAALPSPALAVTGDALVAGGRGSRTSDCQRTPGHTAVRGPAGTALRRQGRSVARAEGPRHHRPRLRHETRRRGEASAASGPRKARTRMVTKVRLAAQPPVDRSVQWLRQRRRWTAPAHRWAARRHAGSRRRGNALAQRLRLACTDSSPRGTVVSTGAAALCPCRGFLPPRIPLSGALRAFLSRCKRLECTAAGLLRQEPASRCAPARTAPTDEPPAQAGGRARQASVLADRGHRPWAYRGTGGARACRTRRERRPADRVGTTCPHTPAQVAPLRCRSNGLLLPGCVPRIGPLWKASHGRGGLAGGRSLGAAPLACGWPLRFFLLEGDARYAALAPASRPARRAPQLRWVPALTPAPFAWASPRKGRVPEPCG